MNWTDKDIDKLFRNAAEKHSVPYDDSYWKEFEQNLPIASNEWSDNEIDKLFKRAAFGFRIPYSPAYWNEFELSMPGVEPGWSDIEIDGLFKSEAVNQSIEYKDAYWHEFESTLPQDRRRDVVWFFFAFTFISVLGAMLMNNKSLKGDQVHTAQVENRESTRGTSNKEISDQSANTDVVSYQEVPGATTVPKANKPEPAQFTSPEQSITLESHQEIATNNTEVYETPEQLIEETTTAETQTAEEVTEEATTEVETTENTVIEDAIETNEAAAIEDVTEEGISNLNLRDLSLLNVLSLDALTL